MGGDNGGVLDAHAARICADAVAIPILRRAAVGGDIGVVGDGQATISVNAVAAGIRRTALGGNSGGAGDTKAIRCIDAVAITRRRAAGHIELAVTIDG